MSNFETAINSLNIENRFDKVMNKLGLSSPCVERISVPEAAHTTTERAKDVKPKASPELNLKK